MENKTRYITEKEVSSITGLALSTLRNDRATLRRIPYCKVGRSVRYLMEDVINFMESNKIASGMNKNGADDFKTSLTI
jgi:predicted DNA-binding transcriptional regulator AlpA